MKHAVLRRRMRITLDGRTGPRQGRKPVRTKESARSAAAEPLQSIELEARVPGRRIAHETQGVRGGVWQRHQRNDLALYQRRRVVVEAADQCAVEIDLAGTLLRTSRIDEGERAAAADRDGHGPAGVTGVRRATEQA